MRQRWVVRLVLGLTGLACAGVVTLLIWARRPPSGGGEYVALGSSFAAGPGIGTRAPGSFPPCVRSVDNYAHQLAALRQLDLTDVTCTGATALNVLEGGPYFQPPQLEALRSDTRLVTVTVGGNDVFYLPNLFAWSSAGSPERSPRWFKLLDVHSDTEVDAVLAQLPVRFDRIPQAVRRRSPHAILVFVDYTTVLPEQGTCPDRLPITSAQSLRARAVARRLEEVTAQSAERAEATLLRASAISRGHDLCTSEPWIFDLRREGPMPYHPSVVAMRAIAQALDAALPADLRHRP